MYPIFSLVRKVNHTQADYMIDAVWTVLPDGASSSSDESMIDVRSSTRIVGVAS